MDGCLIAHTGMWMVLLRDEHPIGGILFVIVLVMLLIRLPLKLLGMAGSAVRGGVGSVFGVFFWCIKAVFKIPMMLFSSGEDPVARFRRFNYEVPNPHRMRNQLSQEPRPRKPFHWQNFWVYLAGAIVFLLILDSQYNNCAGLDGVMRSFF